MLRFLFNRQAPALLVELGHAVPLRIRHPVAEHRGLAFSGVSHGFPEQFHEAVAVEDVVSEHKADIVVSDELLSDYEGLRETVRRRLFRITEADSEIAPVTEKSSEGGQVDGRRDNQYVPDTGEHECRNRVIDHRFVENRQHLFADPLGDGVETGAGTSGQNYAFHCCIWIFENSG